MTNYRAVSLWHDQLGDVEPRAPLSAQDRTTRWDVIIAGAGFTGLWTALGVTEHNPNARVLVLDKHVAGFGASGRNGGWVSALFPTEMAKLVALHGVERATALREAMQRSVDSVGSWADRLGIDADFVKGGTTLLARSDIEYHRAQEHLAETTRFGVDRLEWREPENTLRSPGVQGATWTPDCARVHPGKLVRGLAQALEERGVVIREHTEVTSIRQGEVHTSEGVVRAGAVVDALEAYRSTLSHSKRATLPLYSLMIATEPLGDEVFDQIGLPHGETFADYRRLIIYGQRTADNRIAFGGRGAPYHFGSRIRPEYDRVDSVFGTLERTLKELFPQIGDATITHRWGGPLGIPRDWHARVTFDKVTRRGRAGGYVGDGVALSQLAGFTLADLIMGATTERTALPLVDDRWPEWEIEPLRYLGATAGILGTAIADRIESRTGKPSLIGRMIDPLTGS